VAQTDGGDSDAPLCRVIGRARLPPAASANDKVSFGLDWKAEAEYGGFYQAAANRHLCEAWPGRNYSAGWPAGKSYAPSAGRAARLQHLLELLRRTRWTS
jgi:hypothetical protein